jgi:hypothetical protein
VRAPVFAMRDPVSSDGRGRDEDFSACPTQIPVCAVLRPSSTVPTSRSRRNADHAVHLQIVRRAIKIALSWPARDEEQLVGVV